MLASIKKALVIAITLVLTALPVLSPVYVSAVDQASKDAACKGIGATGPNCNNAQANRSIQRLITSVVNILSWIVGVAAVIMMIIGGFRYVTSGGDSNAISSAKNTVLYALIGVVVAVLAQALVQFVLKKTT